MAEYVSTPLPWCRFWSLAVALVAGVVVGVPLGVWIAWREGE